ncbi:LAETG motif-containing sortase-dependent surface protein [Kitasatospora sp. NPDC101183]|uniref:LAETG motif-containing sortase-dependent surface protein n=1 Tax=Kitasatospora sp. NPDC101183 TaxID=3364100 RepID=UPI003821840C
MKLRRGFAIPTAAVIASAAVLAAAPIAAAAPTETPSAAATAGATASAAAATATASPSANASASASPAATATASPSASASVTPTDKPTDSTEVVLPKLTLTGFPAKIVAGAPAVEFSAEVANTSGKESAILPYLVIGTAHNKLTDSQVKLQFLDPDTKTWKNATPETNTGFEARVLDLGDEPFFMSKDEKLTIQLKLSFTADAQGDEAAAELAGFYYERRGETAVGPGFPVSNIAQFQLVAAGGSGSSNNGGSTPVTLPDSKKTGKGKAKPDAVSKAKSKAGSRAGNLAETGGGSNTTAIALTGAGVVALGAGTLVFLRRRKAGASA